jgi:hypothetical protein
MLKSGRSIRFTGKERDDLAELGIDIDGIKSADDFAAALEPWLHALAETRPDLLDNIAGQILAAKGVRLPPQEPREH